MAALHRERWFSAALQLRKLREWPGDRLQRVAWQAFTGCGKHQNPLVAARPLSGALRCGFTRDSALRAKESAAESSAGGMAYCSAARALAAA